MPKMIQLPIEEATDSQLSNYVDSLGLEIKPNEGRTGLLVALAGPAWGKPFILVPEEVEAALSQSAPVIVVPDERLSGGIGDDDPKVILKIGMTEMPGGRDPVPVSVNGRAVVLQRNMKIELPLRYYFALMNAVRYECSQDKITDEIVETPVRNYPMEVLQMPSQQEINDWLERTQDQVNPA